MLRAMAGRWGWRVAAAGVLAAASAAHAADGPGSLEQRLTGGSSRAWTVHGAVRPPVAGDGCAPGTTYTFAVTHDLLVTRCQAGRLVASHHPWSVHGSGRAPVLELGGIGTYELVIGEAQPDPRRLRFHVARAVPGWPAGDGELQAGED